MTGQLDLYKAPQEPVTDTIIEKPVLPLGARVGLFNGLLSDGNEGALEAAAEMRAEDPDLVTELYRRQANDYGEPFDQDRRVHEVARGSHAAVRPVPRTPHSQQPRRTVEDLPAPDGQRHRIWT